MIWLLITQPITSQYPALHDMATDHTAHHITISRAAWCDYWSLRPSHHYFQRGMIWLMITQASTSQYPVLHDMATDHTAHHITISSAAWYGYWSHNPSHHNIQRCMIWLLITQPITSHFTMKSTGRTQHQFRKSDLNNAVFLNFSIIHTHTQCYVSVDKNGKGSAAGNMTGYQVTHCTVRSVRAVARYTDMHRRCNVLISKHYVHWQAF
jgi:hypothetical protein